MNPIYFSFLIIVNLYIQPAYSAKEKANKKQDTLVNAECVSFDITERFCREEGELKYGESSKNQRNQCCVLLVEIECLRPRAEKACVQHPFFHKMINQRLDDKIAFKNLQCGGYQFDCPEESYNIWMMIITIFTASIAIASFCIICFIYIKS